MKRAEKVAVASRSFSRNVALREELLARYSNVTFNETGKSLAGTELIQFLQGHEKAITALETIDSSILSQLPELKLVSKYGVGMDMLDLRALHAHGVQLGWSGGVNKRSVAELALSFLLMLFRGIPQGSRDLSAGKWFQHPGRELTGKTIGVIGCGHVGKELIRLLNPFQCTVLVHDLLSFSEFYSEHSVEPVSLDEVLSRADGISLHIPLDSTTRALLNRDRLSRLKPGAVLVNTARGGIVDESALKSLLKTGQVGAAGFDVFDGEPPQDLELLSLPNFCGTPHIGGSTAESILSMGRAAIDNLEVGRSALEYLPR